ncbi:PilN domain-containing protein [Paenibacillus sp. HJGM_3]|uniref:PilN domain-containing protein n=1 Tax=Paenibacillus sp. HJGM_3 TaxID=3379816 RepID=UPI0038599758
MSAPTQRLLSLEINLLQMRQEEQTAGSPLLRNLAIVALVVIVAGMGWMYFDAKAEIKKTNAALDKVNAQIKEGQAKLASSPTAGGAADFAQLPQSLSASRPNPSEVLDKLTALMPLASNLTTLSFGDGNALKVTGNFASTEDVVSFMQAAKSSASFTFVSSSGMTKLPAQPEDKNAVAGADTPLPVIQATFDLTYNADSGKKG